MDRWVDSRPVGLGLKRAGSKNCARWAACSATPNNLGKGEGGRGALHTPRIEYLAFVMNFCCVRRSHVGGAAQGTAEHRRHSPLPCGLGVRAAPETGLSTENTCVPPTLEPANQTCKSASMQSITGYLAMRKPKSTAELRPRPCDRRNDCGFVQAMAPRREAAGAAACYALGQQ